ncbi:hypothetical protein NMG60_11017381 [Bertholletia excelsa]
MNVDCLVNIFERVGMESLLLDVPFVCKSWYKATLNPNCWKRLLFPKLDHYDYSEDSRLEDAYRFHSKSAITSFVKFVVKRSKRQGTVLALPACCTEEALLYAAEECPELRCLVLRSELLHDHGPMILEIISKWKNLEFIRLVGSLHLQEILGRVSTHCRNFNGLGATAYIGEEATLAIVTLVPKIKYLDLRRANIERKNLMKILKECRELEYLDARDCIGFDEDDEEIIKLGSHIRKFMREGSMLYDYDDFKCSYRDDGFHDDTLAEANLDR